MTQTASVQNIQILVQQRADTEQRITHLTHIIAEFEQDIADHQKKQEQRQARIATIDALLKQRAGQRKQSSTETKEEKKSDADLLEEKLQTEFDYDYIKQHFAKEDTGKTLAEAKEKLAAQQRNLVTLQAAITQQQNAENSSSEPPSLEQLFTENSTTRHTL